MKIEIKITGMRRCGKSTLMQKLVNVARGEMSSPDGVYSPVVSEIKYEGPGLITEVVTVEGSNHAERLAHSILNCMNELSEEDFKKSFPKDV